MVSVEHERDSIDYVRARTESRPEGWKNEGRAVDLQRISSLSDDQLQQEICEQDVHVKTILRRLFECRDSKDFTAINAEFTSATMRHRFLIEELEKRCKFASSPRKEALSAEMEALRYQLESNLKNQRKAIVEGREAIKQAERERLFGGIQTEEEMEIRQRRDKAKYTAENAAKVTEDLYRIRSLLAEQVEQSRLSYEAAVISSENLHQIQYEFLSMRGVIAQSKALLNKYSRREITENILLILSFVLFYSTCAYIVWKRLH